MCIVNGYWDHMAGHRGDPSNNGRRCFDNHNITHAGHVNGIRFTRGYYQKKATKAHSNKVTTRRQ